MLRFVLPFIVFRELSCQIWQLSEGAMARICGLRRHCRLVRAIVDIVGRGFIVKLVEDRMTA